MTARRIFAVSAWSVAFIFWLSAVGAFGSLSRWLIFVLSGFVGVSADCPWTSVSDSSTKGTMVRRCKMCFIKLSSAKILKGPGPDECESPLNLEAGLATLNMQVNGHA